MNILKLESLSIDDFYKNVKYDSFLSKYVGITSIYIK